MRRNWVCPACGHKCGPLRYLDQPPPVVEEHDVPILGGMIDWPGQLVRKCDGAEKPAITWTTW